MPNAAETLRALAEKARRKDLPRRHELAAVALEIGAEALERVRTFTRKDGEPVEYDSPNDAAAIRAVEVAAALALKFEKPGDHDQQADQMPLDDFVAELAASGIAEEFSRKLAAKLAEQKAPPDAAIQ